MLELLDRIRERNFGRNVELRSYSGNNSADIGLIAAGIGTFSLYVDGQDAKVTLYDFNTKRKPELDAEGKYDDSEEIDNIITQIIRKREE